MESPGRSHPQDTGSRSRGSGENVAGTIALTGQAYPGSRFRGRLWPWVIGAAFATVIANSIVASVPALMAFLPLASLPMLALVVVLLVRSRARQLSLLAKGNVVEVHGKEPLLVGTIEQGEIVPWILAGLGTTHGAVLLARGRTEAGHPFSLTIAAADVAAPVSSQHAGCERPDLFVGASDLQSLLDHFRTTGRLRSPGAHPGDDRRFALVRRPRFRDTMGVILSWVGTVALLGVFASLLGDVLTATPLGTALFVLVGLLVLAFGFWRTFKRAQPAKTRFELVVGDAQVEVRRADGEIVWRLDGAPLDPVRETYVYRTRYSSHRFPVMKIGGKGNELRLCVWDPRFANRKHPKGPAPDYLVGVPDWPRLERVLGHRERVTV